MKKAFIFDLCTAICAATLKDEKGEEDIASNELLVAVIKNCNPIRAPQGYQSKYMAIWSDLHNRKEFLDTGIFRLWNMAWGIQGKVDFASGSLAVVEEVGLFHKDDVDIVELASKLDKGVVLVTTDDRLRKKLVELGVPGKYGFEVMRPEDALDRVTVDM